LDKVSVTINKELPLGTLLWIYSSNGKMFHSTKRFDTKTFNNHDSVSLEQYQVACNSSDSCLPEMLQKTNRIYGISFENTKAYFFLTLDELYSFGTPYFTALDRRKEEARKNFEERTNQLKKEDEERRARERRAAIDIHNKKYKWILFPPVFRESHCFRCKNDLYSSTHPLCSVCNWMLCECGGCKCNYMKL
jgi:hypothetical protein